MNAKAIGVLAILAVLAFLTVIGIGNKSVEQPVYSQTEDFSVVSKSRIITVTGDADVRVIPDEVVITLGVETSDEDITQAKNQNDEIIRQVFSIAEDFDIESRYIKTDYLTIEPRYEDLYKERNFLGYYVRKTVVITLRDLDKFEALLTQLVDGGVTNIQGIQFRTTELRTYKDQARSLAITAAKEKAAAMAGELGESIGQPQTMSEDSCGWWSPYSSWWGYSWGNSMAQNVIQEIGTGYISSDGTIAPGQITVNAKVTVTFTLE